MANRNTMMSDGGGYARAYKKEMKRRKANVYGTTQNTRDNSVYGSNYGGVASNRINTPDAQSNARFGSFVRGVANGMMGSGARELYQVTQKVKPVPKMQVTQKVKPIQSSPSPKVNYGSGSSSPRPYTAQKKKAVAGNHSGRTGWAKSSPKG